jgi:myo-inositol-1(or 4)-monophosphatase
MLELLEQLFRQVRGYMHSERFDRQSVYAQNAQHTTMQFDREAEDIIIAGLMESGHGFEILTEERPSTSTSSHPAYRIVIDPVDGSTNVQRGIMTAALALAVLPIEAPIAPGYVQWALVGELFSGTVYEASKGSGAFCNGRLCQVSNTVHYQDSIIGLNFDGRDRQVLRKLLIDPPPPAHVRRSGSSAMDIAYVANGAYDAYIDIGDIVTAESFLASASIVIEAGGIVTDQVGKPVQPITSLTEGRSLVIAGTRELHDEILMRVKTKAVR